MKKLFFGLLIIAAGAGAFFYFKNKKPTIAASSDQKELILGKWKVDLYQPAKDSAQPLYRYDFLKNGILIQLLNDTIKADTLYYGWEKNNEIVWKQTTNDSSGIVFTVAKLTFDSLLLQSADSTSSVFLTKVK